MTAWLNRSAIGHAVLPTSVSPVVAQIAVVLALIGGAAAVTAAFRWIAEVVTPPPARRVPRPRQSEREHPNDPEVVSR
jgi:hypothetical protein